MLRRCLDGLLAFASGPFFFQEANQPLVQMLHQTYALVTPAQCSSNWIRWKAGMKLAMVGSHLKASAALAISRRIKL